MSSHEKLHVYQDALSFVTEAEALIECWDRRHAIADHLPRAAESVVVNLAESVRADSPKRKETSMDYSLGSVFECAACLDIAVVKGFLDPDRAIESKTRLAKICGELIGLRKSWSAQSVGEGSTEYPARDAQNRPIFHHERLDVYQVALEVFKRLDFNTLLKKLPVKVFQKYDEAGTSMVLNIAEGNGRYAELDHGRFLRLANQSSIRLSALLDVGRAKGLWDDESLLKVKGLLERVARMTRAMLKRR